MKNFFLLPFWLRVVLLLLFVIVLLWSIFGKIILRILSLIPFVLKKVCWRLYLLLETPIAFLHKRFGSTFGKIDNVLLGVAEKVDTAMKNWYKAWHSPDKIHFGRLLLVYFVCVAFIVLPSFVNIDNKILRFGETTYVHYETSLADWLKEHGWYDSVIKSAWNQDETNEEDVVEYEDEIIEDDFEEITLIVSGVDTSLLIRDIPSVEECTILERLQNDDMVTWEGQLTFAEAENEHIEPWVKVITASGVEGWCRLFYLHPDENESKEFRVTNVEE